MRQVISGMSSVAWLKRSAVAATQRMVLTRRCASSKAETYSKGVNFATQVKAGNYGLMISSDMPVDGGGKGAGPSPKDLAMAGLAACTSMTIQARLAVMVSSGRLPEAAVQSIQVFVEDNTPAKKHMPDGIKVNVHIKGDIDEPLRKQLVVSSKTCPVKRIMSGEIEGGPEMEFHWDSPDSDKST